MWQNHRLPASQLLNLGWEAVSGLMAQCSAAPLLVRLGQGRKRGYLWGPGRCGFQGWRPVRGLYRELMLLGQVLVPNAQWGQTNRNVGVCSRERFIAGPSLKSPMLPKVFLQGIFKSRVWEGDHKVGTQLVHSSVIGWWWWNRVVWERLTLSVLRLQEAWGYMLIVIHYW